MNASRKKPHPLAVARMLRGMSQVELAALTGLSREALAHIEVYKRSPRLDTMNTISAALGLPIGVLFDPAPLTPERTAELAPVKAKA